MYTPSPARSSALRRFTLSRCLGHLAASIAITVAMTGTGYAHFRGHIPSAPVSMPRIITLPPPPPPPLVHRPTPPGPQCGCYDHTGARSATGPQCC